MPARWRSVPNRTKPMVPEFGLPYIKYPYIEDDLREADRTFATQRTTIATVSSTAAKPDGRSGTHRDPFEEDYDKDNRLSRMELAQRYRPTPTRPRGCWRI